MTINIGEAQNLSRNLTRWIVTSVFTLPVNTGDVLSQHLPRKVRGLVPRQIHELLFSIEGQLIL